ncbi:MAG: 3-hydroxyisobutyrate dehydrogenase [Alphaproteobacteria bacterium]|nr:3-hydroxyisobutyrate dehydrogenase [Alphaproteobacteria bacterium]MBV9693992.1 3-hydroxyisobutyrate dehydrogenase [Alphaproteobacteria bacterium]
MTHIAFIGVGNMGGPMARNLLKASERVTAFDLSAEALEPLVGAGAAKASTVNDAVKDADVVITMLPAGQHVRSVYLDNGILGAGKKGALLIDSSTIDVDSARAVHAAAEKAGFDFLDAPVSGGTGGAEAGTLAFMCGGSEKAFGRAQPVLEKMGKRIVHAGGPGAGQAAKICNNMLLAISMIGTCEAFVLGEKLGLDPQKLFDIMSAASGQCWSLTTYCPVPGPVPASPANRAYSGGFATALMLKDLKLSQTAAQSAGAVTPLGAEAAQLYSLFANQGRANVDFSGIIEMLRGIR